VHGDKSFLGGRGEKSYSPKHWETLEITRPLGGGEGNELHPLRYPIVKGGGGGLGKWAAVSEESNGASRVTRFHGLKILG